MNKSEVFKVASKRIQEHWIFEILITITAVKLFN